MVDADWPRDVKLVGYIILSSLGIVMLTLTFAAVIALLCRLLVVIIFVRPPSKIPHAIFTMGSSGLPLWLSVGVPAIVTFSLFIGLVLLNRWQRGRHTRRLELTTRNPPAEIRHRVTRLAKVADMAPPSVAMVESDVATVFTTGVGPNTAQITVSSALVERLSDTELDGVLAHELSHIKNRDITVMSSMMVPIVVAAGLWTMMSSDPSRQIESRSSGFRFEGVISGLFGLTAGIFWPLACLSTAPFVRYRELAADRGAAAITGEPGALATALEALDGQTSPTTDMRLVEVSPIAIFPISDTIEAWTGGWDKPTVWLPSRVRDRLSMYMRTHPATETRVRRLRALQTEL